MKCFLWLGGINKQQCSQGYSSLEPGKQADLTSEECLSAGTWDEARADLFLRHASE